MLSRSAERILEENKVYFEILEKLDETGIFALDKVRKDFTLKQRTIHLLKKQRKETNKSMSDIIDDLVEDNLRGH